MAKSKKARKTYAKTDAGKSERFRDFANVRMNRALKAVEAVAKLANKRSYGYTDTHAKNIKAALTASVEKCASAFDSGTAESGFKIE